MKKCLLLLFFVLCPKLVFSHDLHDIIKRGYLNCGIYMNEEAMVLDDSFIDAEICKIVSKALFDTKGAVEFISLPSGIRFDALEHEEIDMFLAIKNRERANDKRFIFPIIYMYDKQLLVTFEKNKVKSIDDFPKHTKICVTKNTAPEADLKEFIKKYPQGQFEIISHSMGDMSKKFFLRGDCDILTAESIVISKMFSNEEFNGKIHILPEVVKVIGISSIVGYDSLTFARFLKTLRNAMLRAWSLGITRSNIDDVLKTTQDKEILFMLGEIEGIGKIYNMDDKWIYRVIKEYGNYNEFFEERYGKSTRYNLVDKNLNKTVEEGGYFEVNPFVPPADKQ